MNINTFNQLQQQFGDDVVWKDDQGYLFTIGDSTEFEDSEQIIGLQDSNFCAKISADDGYVTSVTVKDLNKLTPLQTQALEQFTGYNSFIN